MLSASLLSKMGQVPILGSGLRWYARQYKEGSVITIRNGQAAGMRWVRHHRYVNGYWTGIYELPLQNAFAREIVNGDVVYDIGANAGFFTIMAAKLVGSVGRVFAFEPLPENILSIRKQITINSLRNCELVEKAVAGNCGVARLTTTDSVNTAHLLDNNENYDPTSKHLIVNTVTLDDFASGQPPPTFVKVDVEGAESAVLSGASKLLSSQTAPKFLIELHGAEETLKVGMALRRYDYRVFDLHGNALADGLTGHSHILAYPSTYSEIS